MQSVTAFTTWPGRFLEASRLMLITTCLGLAPAFGQPSDADAVVCGQAVVAAPLDPAEAQAVNVSIPQGAYRITPTEQGQEVFVEGFGYLRVPGCPALPSRIFALAIPPGAQVVAVGFETGEPVSLPGVYDIVPSPLPRVIGPEDPAIYESNRQQYEENRESTYGSDEPYPSQVVEFVRTAGYRRYNLVDVRVTPFGYRPLSGRLTYYPEITVRVDYAFPAKPRPAVVDHLATTQRVAEDIILNHDQARNWYPRAANREKGLHGFVIITLDSLTSSVGPVVDWETEKGRTVEVATTSWIDSNYAGYDLAEKIRNFLRDKYPSSEWGIEDVLLVGHYDDVPMRRTARDLGYGAPETDLYYAELSLPDHQSWDADGDHQYGEYSDPIDFYTEVNVGRIPWSGVSTVQSICEKSVAYEQNEDPAFKKNMLLLGAFFWNNDPYPRTDNAILMEAKIAQPWMADWTFTRMYEKNSDCSSSYDCDYPLSHSKVLSVWPSGTFAFVNWAGHGSPVSSHVYGLGMQPFIQSLDCNFLNDDYPAIIFADACSNSDTDHANLGQAMMKRGAVGFVGATKVAMGCPAWNDPYDGSSQSLDYFFTTRVTSGDHTQGQALQAALRDMYTYGLWSYPSYEMFEWGALWGNPDLGMAPICPLANRPRPANELRQSCADDGDCMNRATCLDGVCYVAKNRYVSFAPNNGDATVAFRVTHVDTGRQWWVSGPFEASGEPGTWLARLVHSPVWRVWGEAVIHVGDCPIVPMSGYEVQAIDVACDASWGMSFSSALTLPTALKPRDTSHWADCVGEFTNGQWTPSDGFVNFHDTSAVVRAFQRVPGVPWPEVSWVDIHGADFGDPTTDPPNGLANFGDIQYIILAFQGNPYPFCDPANCP